MAKKTMIQMFNAVLRETGQGQVTSLAALTGLTRYSWDMLQQAIREIYNEENWEFSEVRNTITMASTASYYAWPSNLKEVDPSSFRNRKSDQSMEYQTRERFYASHPDWLESNKGTPKKLYSYRRRFYPFPVADSNNHGSLIDYDGWIKGSTLATTTTGSQATLARFPEEFEDDAIVKLAAAKVMAKRGSPEADNLYNHYYGFLKPDGEKIDGALDRMKRTYRNEPLDVRVESY